MQNLFEINWNDLFVPQSSLLEMIIRGTLMYFAVFVLLRFLRRGVGAIGITDLLVIVLVSEAASNGITGDYKSIPEGVVTITTITLWDYLLDWLGSRFKFIQRILRPPALPLIENGELNRRNMRKEFITYEELMSLLRQQGVDDINQVKKCCLEGDGNLSVIKNDSSDSDQQSQSKDKQKKAI